MGVPGEEFLSQFEQYPGNESATDRTTHFPGYEAALALPINALTSLEKIEQTGEGIFTYNLPLSTTSKKPRMSGETARRMKSEAESLGLDYKPFLERYELYGGSATRMEKYIHFPGFLLVVDAPAGPQLAGKPAPTSTTTSITTPAITATKGMKLTVNTRTGARMLSEAGSTISSHSEKPVILPSPELQPGQIPVQGSLDSGDTEELGDPNLDEVETQPKEEVFQMPDPRTLDAEVLLQVTSALQDRKFLHWNTKIGYASKQHMMI